MKKTYEELAHENVRLRSIIEEAQISEGLLKGVIEVIFEKYNLMEKEADLAKIIAFPFKKKEQNEKLY